MEVLYETSRRILKGQGSIRFLPLPFILWNLGVMAGDLAATFHKKGAVRRSVGDTELGSDDERAGVSVDFFKGEKRLT